MKTIYYEHFSNEHEERKRVILFQNGKGFSVFGRDGQPLRTGLSWEIWEMTELDGWHRITRDYAEKLVGRGLRKFVKILSAKQTSNN